MLRLILIAVTLYVYWLLLSGHYALWLLVSGAVLTVAVVIFAHVKGIIDAEGFPVERIGGGLLYWPWLAWQIVLSALNVTRLILDPRLPITPTMVRVQAGQTSSVGLTTYANSITLTPGTISVEVSENAHAIWVHAITTDGADGFRDDPMNERVREFEGHHA
ncbi:MAG TPA: Na+/H+ antiporter subunit E [Thermohalobaculum sp.]|nr:Na+/H+ antiporter subunit E [Thermohalobaculum sp.]